MLGSLDFWNCKILVSTVPSEPRWASPRRQHIKCPDDGSSTSNTLAVAFLVSDINNVYENFVIKVLVRIGFFLNLKHNLLTNFCN